MDFGGALGSAIGGWFGYRGQKAANETNIQLGREQMAFQERMSNTSYQRGVKDMQEAGLNPMLAYSQGGASAPLGSMPRVENAAGAGVSSAAQGANLVSAVQAIMKSKADTELVEAETKRVQSQTFDHSVNSAIRSEELQKHKLGNLYTEDDIRVLRQELAKRQLDNARSRLTFDADVQRRKDEAAITGYGVSGAKSESDYWSKMESAPKEIKFLLDTLHQIFGIRNSIRR